MKIFQTKQSTILRLRPSEPTDQQRKKVSRCLFGRSNSGERDAYLKGKLEEIRRQDIENWGFDFQTGSPVSFQTSSEWEWSTVDAASIPGFYRPPQTSTPPPTCSEDERGDLQLNHPRLSDPEIRDSQILDDKTPKKRKLDQPDGAPRSPKKARSRVNQYFSSRKFSSTDVGSKVTAGSKVSGISRQCPVMPLSSSLPQSRHSELVTTAPAVGQSANDQPSPSHGEK